MNTTASQFSIFESVKAAWHNVKGSKEVFWITLVLILFTQIIFMELSKYITTLPKGSPLFTLSLLSLAVLILRTILVFGVIYFGIERAFGKPILFKQISYVFNMRLFFKMLGIYILSILIFIPPLILILFPAIMKKLAPDLPHFTQTLIAFSFVLGLILFIFLAVRLSLARAIVIAENAGPWNAIKVSFKATQSNVWKLIGLLLVNIIIILVSLLPLGIGLIWSLPYVYINYGIVYKKLVVRL